MDELLNGGGAIVGLDSIGLIVGRSCTEGIIVSYQHGMAWHGPTKAARPYTASPWRDGPTAAAAETWSAIKSFLELRRREPQFSAGPSSAVASDGDSTVQ